MLPNARPLTRERKLVPFFRKAALAPAVTLLVAACRSESGHAPDFPLVVDAGPDLRAYAGAAVPLTFRASDSAETRGPWSYEINWGDGSVDTGHVTALGQSVTATHVYAAPGNHVAAVTVSQADGEAASQAVAVLVEPPGTPEVFVGAGDIASCDSTDTDDEGTAELLDGIPGTVFTLGDNAYEDGTPAEYARCYQPTWGRHRKRTRPSPGNHDYLTPTAKGYFAYFGVAAADRDKGYYSYDLGDWHIIVLNSNIDWHAGRPQEQWLRADLAASTKRCTLAYWHHPRFSSGTTHGGDPGAQAFWQALYDAGADVVLSGHEHNYERFAPQTPDGTADSVRGIRQFVAGTGGEYTYRFGPPVANSEVRARVHGVFKLTLSSGSYTWQFIPVAGQTFSDSGSGTCH